MNQDATWPNVTLPHFLERVSDAVTLTGSELFGFTPIVPVAQKSSFEIYAAAEWINNYVGEIPSEIHNVDGEATVGMSQQGFYAPLWQVAPQANDLDIILLDMTTFPWFQQLEMDVLEVHHAVISGIVDVEYLLEATRSIELMEWHPRSVIMQDIPKSMGTSENATHTDISYESVEVNDHCGSVVTYKIDGHEATVVGNGNLHDSKYDYLHLDSDFAGSTRYDGTDSSGAHCYYVIDVYPTDELKELYTTHTPILFASAILGVFLFTIGIFFCYNCAVERRQRRIASIAKRTNNIVKSLFPKNVQERIMAEAIEEAEKAEQAGKLKGKGAYHVSVKDRLKETLTSSLQGDGSDHAYKNVPPIADLFPSTTIMIWLVSLLGVRCESLPEFDLIAHKRRVFKVETVGDCYVAACGLPDPRRDHAVAMARFARDCRACMLSLMTQLEVTLGPDTGELGLRIGLHSGPVTGGVLRGDKARFQLFGDTMNTTARIETTGKKNMIHISETTANILQAFGKGHWTKLREDKVNAKGKGEMTTYWLVKTDGPKSTSSGISSSEGTGTGQDDDANSVNARAVFQVEENHVADSNVLTDKALRLVKWNSDVIGRILKDVMQRRQALNVSADLEAVRRLEKDSSIGHVFDEITEVLNLPKFDAEATARQNALNPITLDPKAAQQLEAYVHAIATLYHDNPFHNFEHVSHVIMSVTKLFSRIVAPEVSGDNRALHDHTYGITSDPLTHFAAVFAALIHDVDHQGVTNATLVDENNPLATVYNNKSVAEQNSVDIAWSLLMDDAFIDFRNCIYTTPAEYRHFRQLIVNLVMATDIMDKSLSQARKDRWATAFSDSSDEYGSSLNTMEEEIERNVNRKATIVLEHVIQASDVSHTMQHWHIYRKWNARLFEEMMKAYRQGRTQVNPADRWYEGEKGFFDFYIIPLAKKLKDCGVFGVSSEEYLNYAETNRKEWEAKGEALVAEMIAKFQEDPFPSNDP
ncbi:hypothetical protein FisN_14Hh306 [Fistulifera solaris]|uniref:Phosphodiesterase n=1 Tax=Fistulifera solaris TaxID=1519565 RepID=A0A1Z5KB90_FISSO|nr:hypothetical protein FisN_14Hh306 [Fistulifera solaris]|eukprot:GAX23519.1 hypothetical protein FisN_14Hh306 [Fistulifera solaris]